jgi:hypothetical protein
MEVHEHGWVVLREKGKVNVWEVIFIKCPSGSVFVNTFAPAVKAVRSKPMLTDNIYLI